MFTARHVAFMRDALKKKEEKKDGPLRCGRSPLQRAHDVNNMQLFFLPYLSIPRSSFVNGFALFLCICATETAMHMHAPCIFMRDVNDNETTAPIT